MTLITKLKFNKSPSPTKQELLQHFNLYNHNHYEVFCNCVGNFFVSNLGNVKRQTFHGDFVDVWTYHTNKNYLYFKCNQKKYKIHQQVLKSFIGDRPEGYVVDHIDRNRQNNHINNLRYATPKENAINSIRYRTDVLETDPKKRKQIINKLNYEKRKQRIKELSNNSVQNIIIVLT
jgi:hypothetical protein